MPTGKTETIYLEELAGWFHELSDRLQELQWAARLGIISPADAHRRACDAVTEARISLADEKGAEQDEPCES